MPACLLFDLFGTLVEYDADRTNFRFDETYRVCSALGARCTQEEFLNAWESAFEACQATSNTSGKEFLMEDVAERVFAGLDIGATSAARQQLIDTYMAEWSEPIRPVTGATGLLDRLGKHYELGLISNTHHGAFVRELLDRFELTRHFKTLTLSAEFGVPKPDDRIFRHALESVGFAASEAAYIGDSYEHDYEGATSAGMDCYLIGRHARVPRAKQLSSVMDLPIHFKTARD